MRALLLASTAMLLACPAWADGAIPAPIGLTPFVTSVPNASVADTIANRMAALPNVRSDFGTLVNGVLTNFDGTHSDTAALTAASNASPDGTILLVPGTGWLGGPPARPSANGSVLWWLNGNKLNGGTPVTYGGVDGDTTFSLVGGVASFYKRVTTQGSGAGVLRASLDFNQVTGSAVESALVGNGTLEATHTGTAGIVGVLGVANQMSATGSAYGGFFQAIKTAAGVSTGIYAEARDNTGLPTSTGKQSVGAELDNYANKPDDLAGGGRGGMVIAFGKSPIGYDAGPVSWAFGVSIGPSGGYKNDTTLSFGDIIRVSGQFSSSVFNTTKAVSLSGAPTIAMATSQTIALDNAGASSAPVATLASNGVNLVSTAPISAPNFLLAGIATGAANGLVKADANNLVSFQQIPAAVSGMLPGGRKAGRVFTADINAYTTGVPTAGRLYAIPVTLSGSISQININVTTFPGASAVRVGVYSDTGSGAAAPLFDSGSVAISATGNQAINVTGISSYYGTGWIVFAFSGTNTPTVTTVASGLSRLATQQLGTNTAANGFSGTAGLWSTGVYSPNYSDTTLATALPASFGTGLSVNIGVPVPLCFP